MSGLLELAARCEAASGPDRELDFDIVRALGWTQHTDEDDPVFVRKVSTWWAEPGHEWSTTSVPPAYTASIDAAMTLVPEGYSWAGGDLGEENMPWACVTQHDEPCTDFAVDATTPALALCAAALKARAQSGGQS